jgi:hypothetical protein
MPISRKRVIRKEVVIEPSRRRKVARAFGFVILIMTLLGGSLLLLVIIGAEGLDSGNIAIVILGMIFLAIISGILIHVGRTKREVIEEVVSITEEQEEEQEQYEEKKKRGNI